MSSWTAHNADVHHAARHPHLIHIVDDVQIRWEPGKLCVTCLEWTATHHTLPCPPTPAATPLTRPAGHIYPPAHFPTPRHVTAPTALTPTQPAAARRLRGGRLEEADVASTKGRLEEELATSICGEEEHELSAPNTRHGCHSLPDKTRTRGTWPQRMSLAFEAQGFVSPWSTNGRIYHCRRPGLHLSASVLSWNFVWQLHICVWCVDLLDKLLPTLPWK